MEPSGTQRIYLGLGSNVGDRLTHLRAAVDRLRECCDITAVSAVYDTAPQYFEGQPRFYNLVVAGTTTHEPEALLEATQRIEADLGRIRELPNGPRTVDIDLLLYGSRVVLTPGLTLPHPRLAERCFVLAPLTELAPLLMHPVLGRTMLELARALPPADVRRVGSLLPGEG